MTKNQYVNIVKTTVTQNSDKTRLSLDLGKATLKNLGVPFPSGTLEEAITALNTGKYMGWTPCSAQAAEACINNGYTAVAMNSQDMMVLLPDDTSSENTVAAAAEQNMSFYAYATITEENQTATAANTTTQIPATFSLVLNTPTSSYARTLTEDLVIPIKASGTSCNTIDIYVNDSIVASTTDNSITLDYPVTEIGTYRIYAVGTDDEGNTTTTSAFTVTVVSSPVIELTSPAADYSATIINNDQNIYIAACGTNCTKIDAYVNNILVRSANDTQLNFIYNATSSGTYKIYADAVNLAETSVSSPNKTVTLVEPPIVNMQSPENDITVAIRHDLKIPFYVTSSYCTKLELLMNNSVIATSNDGIINIEREFNAPGTYTFVARGYNSLGFLDIAPSITVTVTNDYVFENEHFIVSNETDPNTNLNLRTEIINYPMDIANFNTYMHRLDLGYEAMYDLVGTEPFPNTKITIRKGKNYGHWQYIIPHDSSIYWDGSNYTNILSELNTKLDDWWLSGSMHELGHIFDRNYDDKWCFTSEGWATYKAWLVIEKLDGKVNGSKPIETRFISNHPLKTGHINKDFNTNGPFKYRKFIGTEHRNYLSGDDIIYYIHPMFNNLGFATGWNILKAVFRSYNDSNFSEPDFQGNAYQRNVQRFIYRCSYFASQLTNNNIDIKNYWYAPTKALYAENVTNRLDSYTYFYVNNTAPKIGQKVSFTAYDLPTTLDTIVVKLIHESNGNIQVVASESVILEADTKNKNQSKSHEFNYTFTNTDKKTLRFMVETTGKPWFSNTFTPTD